MTKNTSLCFSMVAKIFALRSFPFCSFVFLLLLRCAAFDLFDFLAFFWPFFFPSATVSLSSFMDIIALAAASSRSACLRFSSSSWSSSLMLSSSTFGQKSPSKYGNSEADCSLSSIACFRMSL
uniref:Putative secreted peptide n=1 Tax=Anopheles braziliensis TaxID=58242 RepID=A0A2M3ZNU8_9DIPT